MKRYIDALTMRLGLWLINGRETPLCEFRKMMLIDSRMELSDARKQRDSAIDMYTQQVEQTSDLKLDYENKYQAMLKTIAKLRKQIRALKQR
jgi:hypothetical protein